jgi:ABC-type xylose transport system permease subunit
MYAKKNNINNQKIKTYLKKYNLLVMLIAAVLIAVIMTKGIFIRPENLIVV